MSTAVANRVRAVQEKLGLSQEEISTIVGSSQRTIARWSTGRSQPQPSAKDRLLQLAYVADLVAQVMKAEDANLWIMSPNRLLDHDSPAERISVGDYKTVLDLIEALADGVVF